jgi:predicted AAA+ superfamily ATPase
MRRKITGDFLEWRRGKKNECLLVRGARQVGKTYSIQRLGEEHYKSCLTINFFEKPELKKIFDNELSSSEIIKRVQLNFPGFKLIERETLLFLDEIQECPQARTALKFLAQDERIDCIASGSMLGISYKEIASVPVGYERQIEMFSLDFEEFLWAKGITDDVIADVRNYYTEREQLPADVNTAMMKYLREYCVIGGMPEVVKRFVETEDFVQVHAVQQKILDSYLDDIAKYATAAERPKARNCYLSIPKQLAKENKKFQYSVVEKKGTSRKYENTLEWLRDAGLIKFCANVSLPKFPISAYTKDDWYKIYCTDIGILTAMYGFEMKKAVIENSLAGPVKGGIYENLVADILAKKKLGLYYYKPESNCQEIEFLLVKEGDVIPVEVKSGNNATVSLNKFIEKFQPQYAIKLISGNLGVADKKISCPLYMAMFF